jgi:hypothetical protein
MALCHKAQGYGANNRPEALLIKSEQPELVDEVIKDIDFIKAASEVRIDTSMMTFLRKWMGMYWDDAEALSRIMGYEGDGEEASDWIKDRIEGITLLKSDISEKITEKDVKELEIFMKSCDLNKDSLSEGNSDVKIGLNKISQKPSENKLKQNQGDLMAVKDQEKLEKAEKDLEAVLSRIEDMEKSATKANEQALAKEAELNTRIESFEKADKDRTLKAFNRKVETYSFVTPEGREDFVKALMATDSVLIADTLDKAQAAIDALDSPQGSDKASDVTLEKTDSLKAKIEAEYGDKK